METDFAGRKLVAFRRAPKRGRGDGDSELIDDLWRYFDIEMKKKIKIKGRLWIGESLRENIALAIFSFSIEK